MHYSHSPPRQLLLQALRAITSHPFVFGLGPTGLPASVYAPDADMSSSAARIRGPDKTAARWLIRDTSIRFADRVSPIPPLKIGRGK